MITLSQKGDFSKTTNFLQRMKRLNIKSKLEKYGAAGVKALSAATPVDTGNTARSWTYEVTSSKTGYAINFKNSNIVDGVPIAIIIQYGHGTGNGGYVQGRDYINPSVQPIFDQIAKDVWGEVTNA